MKSCMDCFFRDRRWGTCELNTPWPDNENNRQVGRDDSCPVVFLVAACHEQRNRARLAEDLAEERYSEMCRLDDIRRSDCG